MGRRGPAPTPTKVKQLRGETRPSRLNLREPMPSPDVPKMPADMDDAAKAVWRRILREMGVTDYTFTLTAQARARGWDAAFGAGVRRVKEGRSGRGERDSPATNDLPITMRLAEPPEPFELVRSA